jgi:acetylornithine deacetylase/succinyl-diaminopimelate desuccinylase-like protein
MNRTTADPEAGFPLTAEQEEWVRGAQELVTEDRLRELIVGMVAIPSPTGEEGALAEHLAREMAGAGIPARVQPLDDAQANAVGRLAGDGSGADLLLYAPIDTLTDGTVAADVPWIGDELRPDMVADPVVDGPYVTGLGASNPKGHGACVLAAAEAVAAAGVPLRGALLVGFGAGGMPTNARGAGGRDIGHGVGCSFMLEQGVAADAAIIAKPGWTVSWEEVGLAWFEVRVRGTHTYVGSRHRLPFRDPIVDAATVISELEAWFPLYTERHTDGTVAPQAIIAAIEGGWWRTAAVTPALCRFLVDVRISPRSDPAAVAREFGEAVSAIRSRHDGLVAEWDMVVAIPGTATPVDHPIVATTVEAWVAAEGSAHEVIVGNSGATDANILRSRGLPTVRIGMPKVTDLAETVDFARGMNTVDVREMERLTRLLVRASVNFCTRERSAVVPS